MAVAVFKPRDPVGQLFVVVTLLGVLILVFWLLAELGLAWANMLMATAVVLVGPPLVHLHTLFPDRVQFGGKRVLLVGLYLAGLALVLLSNASDLAYYLHPESERVWLASLPTTQVNEAFFLLCLLLSLALLVRGRFFADSEMSRRRANLVLLGTALAMLPLVVLVVLPQLFAAPYLVPTWLPLLALVLIPLSYAYGMYRHDLLKLDRVVNRTMVFSLLGLTLTGLYVGISLAVRRLLPDASPGILTGADAALFVDLVLLANPLKQRTQIAVDRALYGGWYNYQSFIASTSVALRDALDVPGVGQVLERHLRGTMHFKALALLLLGPQAQAFSRRGGQGFAEAAVIGRKGVLARLLLDSGQPMGHAAVCDRLSAESAAGQQLAAWSQAGAQVWAPLVQQEELIGLLVLGGKRGDDLITQGDLEIVDTLAQQTAVAIRRLQLVDNLQGRVEEVQALGRQILAFQERNQHRLSRELHDLVYQRLVVAKMSLERTQNSFVSENITEAHGILLELAVYIRSIMFELRTPDWEDTDLRTELEDYALAFEDREGLPVHLQASGDDPGASVPDGLRTAVYRIFQESLTNVWKHARAQQIEARLDLRPDRVCLEVNDDGVGFEVLPHLGKYVGKGHLGLVSMRERAEEVGGTCTVESEPGKGTRVRVEIPLTA
jgi:signal transduction histidine kinase